MTLDAGAFEKTFGNDPARPLFLYPTDGSTIQFCVPYDYTNPLAARYAQQQPLELKTFSSQQLAYLQRNHFTDRPQGLSPILTAYNYITYLLNANERADDVASNATADFMIYFKEMPASQREEFIKYMQEEIEGTGKIPVGSGPGDLDTKQIRAINKDGLYLEYQQFLMSIVAISFGCPPEKMGLTKSNDRSTAEDIDAVLMSELVKPYADIWEDAVNEHILKPLGFDKMFRFKFVYAQTSDQLKKVEDLAINKYTKDITTVNETRKILGLPPAADKYADMRISEYKANLNADLGINNGGFGDSKNNGEQIKKE